MVFCTTFFVLYLLQPRIPSNDATERTKRRSIHAGTASCAYFCCWLRLCDTRQQYKPNKGKRLLLGGDDFARRCRLVGMLELFCVLCRQQKIILVFVLGGLGNALNILVGLIGFFLFGSYFAVKNSLMAQAKIAKLKFENIYILTMKFFVI